VAECRERLLQMFFERKAGVICSDRDAHDARLYYRGPAVEVRLTPDTTDNP
jgi:hypothetical protein